MDQISAVDFLKNDPEKLPNWLNNFNVGGKVSMLDFFRSRIVYNPGAGFEGGPIKLFNSAHAAHAFVYVDYFFSEETVDKNLSNNAFLGYHLIHEQRVTKAELSPKSVVYHLTSEEKKEIKKRYEWANVPTHNAFAILKIYERNQDVDEYHGAWRFAILFLGADAIATYDVLFGNTNCTPFASVIDQYGFDGSYDSFARHSYIAKIARRSERLPKYLLSPSHCEVWDGYSKIENVSGFKDDSNERFLWGETVW